MAISNHHDDFNSLSTHGTHHTYVHKYTATHCNTLQHTATHCNTLQHTATHCNTLQRTATHCNTLIFHPLLERVDSQRSTYIYTHTHTATHSSAIQFSKDFIKTDPHTSRLNPQADTNLCRCNIKLGSSKNHDCVGKKIHR